MWYMNMCVCVCMHERDSGVYMCMYERERICGVCVCVCVCLVCIVNMQRLKKDVKCHIVTLHLIPMSPGSLTAPVARLVVSKP